MRGVSSTVTARRPVRALWAEASDPKRWAGFAGAFAGWGSRFHCDVVGGPSDPPASGTEVVLAKPGGRTVMRCRVAWWDPLRGFTLTAQSGGWLKAYHGNFTLRLSELDTELTSLELSMQVVFLNRLVELASLVLPVGFLYKRRLARILALLKG